MPAAGATICGVPAVNILEYANMLTEEIYLILDAGLAPDDALERSFELIASLGEV